MCTSTGPLIGIRLVMGTAAALIFPTTLSIITDTFRDPKQRAAAIGVWGAVTGLGVAVGPVLGGALLEHFWWGSVFLALVPLALVAAVGACCSCRSRPTEPGARLDRGGLLASVVMLGALVYTIIEAPDHGWGDARSLLGFGRRAGGGAGLRLVGAPSAHPMIDVSLFPDLRFSAASGAVTVTFFALFGFIFLITQYFQLVQGYGPLETGARILPVALSIAVGSVLGTLLAVTRIGTKAVVSVGLLMLAAAFVWVATVAVDVLLPAGRGADGAAGRRARADDGAGHRVDPGVVRPEQAGAGSAVNDATRQLGGTLGRRGGRQHLLHALHPPPVRQRNPARRTGFRSGNRTRGPGPGSAGRCPIAAIGRRCGGRHGQ